MYQIGDRVKHSGTVIMRKRDYWNSCGREPMKSGARRELDRAIAERGTVTGLLTADPDRGVAAGLAACRMSSSVPNPPHHPT